MSSSVQIPSAESLLDNHTDPEPVEIVNAGSKSATLLVCEHAGRAMPAALGSLGLSDDQLGLHIAYDIGTEELARDLAQRFECTLVLQRYSRLVIDCNRPLTSSQSIPPVSDHVVIPANNGISQAERDARAAEIFTPFANVCETEISKPSVRYAFSIHSFTPRMDGFERPWDIGFLHRHPASRGHELVARARKAWPGMTIGDNQPYSIEDETDWFIPACAEQRNIPHSLVEVRNDHLLTFEGRSEWAGRLYDLLSRFMEHCDATDPKPAT